MNRLWYSTSLWRLFPIMIIIRCQSICFSRVKVIIDFIKTFTNLLTFYFTKSTKSFQFWHRFDLWPPPVGICFYYYLSANLANFLHPGKIHVLNIRINSTHRILTLGNLLPGLIVLSNVNVLLLARVEWGKL